MAPIMSYNLNILIDWDGQTVKTQIILLLKELSDQCLQLICLFIDATDTRVTACRFVQIADSYTWSSVASTVFSKSVKK